MSELKERTQLKMGTWEEAESFLNQNLEPVIGVDAVERGAIRRECETLEFDCPLHYDDAIAREAGYKGIIAPEHMVFTFGMQAYWSPGDPLTQPGDPPKIIQQAYQQVPAPGTHRFATGYETEHFAPMYVGDRLKSTTRLVSIVRKRTRVGDGAFMTFETTYTNQRDELVCIARMTLFRYTPDKKD